MEANYDMQALSELRVRDAELWELNEYIFSSWARYIQEKANPPPRVAQADLPNKRLREVPIQQLTDVLSVGYLTERLRDSSLEDD